MIAVSCAVIVGILLGYFTKSYINFDISLLIQFDKKNKKGEKYDFGCISLSHPKVYIADDELVDYLSWLSDFIKEYFDIFYTLGMEEVWFYTNIYYTDSFLGNRKRPVAASRQRHNPLYEQPNHCRQGSPLCR